MKIYGYELKSDLSIDEDPTLIEIQSATLELTIQDVQRLIAFLQYTVHRFEAHGDDFWHEHYSDFVASIAQNSDIRKMNIPDIVVTKSKNK